MDRVGRSGLLGEVVEAARAWPIWLRIGLQDIRIRFKRSTLGVGWVFVNLAATICTVGYVYGNLLGQDLAQFMPFLSVGLVLWGYLTASVVEGGNAFLISEGYIKQIGLPNLIYVFRFFVSTTITMLISLPVFFLIALVYSLEFRLGALWALPGLVLLCAVAFLMIAIFSHLNARFRDAAHTAGAVLQVLFFLTPIVWPPDALRTRGIDWVIDVNPFYHLLEIVRSPLVMSEAASPMSYFFVGSMIIVLTLFSWALTAQYNRRLAYLL